MSVRLRVDSVDRTDAEANGHVTVPLEVPAELALDLKACKTEELERLADWLESDLELGTQPARRRVRQAAATAGS